MEFSLNIKPLSVNEAWKGRRFKTPAYKSYEKDVLHKLPDGDLPVPPYRVHYEFGFSNKASDIDNPVKLLQDILQMKYKFDDNLIYEMHVKKVIVKKGEEYFKVLIEQWR